MKHNIYKHKTQSLIYQVRSHYCVAGLMRTRKVQSKPRSVLQSEPIQRPAQQKVTSTPSANAPNVLQAAKVLKPFFTGSKSESRKIIFNTFCKSKTYTFCIRLEKLNKLVRQQRVN